MNKQQSILPIGVFDSGIGGISVLAEMVQCLPGEKYLYLADSANAPYGTKDRDSVRDLSLKAARILLSRGIKALVVACNTATSAAINEIRQEFEIPVIGMEPALKPAVEMSDNGCIVVMATPLTLKQEKFNSLYQRFNLDASIMPLPCDGLVELIESEAGAGEVRQYLNNLFSTLPIPEITTIVLGCTHYCFIRNEISEFIGPNVQIIDGNTGTVHYLKSILQSKDLLNPLDEKKKRVAVEFFTTGDSSKIVPLCRRFLQKGLQQKDYIKKNSFS